jgi:hypothetical protein
MVVPPTAQSKPGNFAGKNTSSDQCELKRYLSVIGFILLAGGIQCYSQDKLEITALNRITINHGDTISQFYVAKPPAKINFSQEKNYHWYVKDTILITQSASDGKILNGDYKVFYPNKNLLEKGRFKYGLKTGTWKNWYPNGVLRQTVNWSNGNINGGFEEHDPSGRMIRSGTYKNNLFTGHVYVYLENGSSQKIYYQNGKIVIEKAKTENAIKPNDKKL